MNQFLAIQRQIIERICAKNNDVALSLMKGKNRNRLVQKKYTYV